MKNPFKGLFTNTLNKEIKRIEENMQKVHNLGIIEGRMKLVQELIDLHDGNVSFLEALKEVQARNGEMLSAIKKES